MINSPRETAVDIVFRKRFTFFMVYTFWKIPTATSTVKFSVTLPPTDMRFVNSSILKLSKNFQKMGELSRGDLQGWLLSIN